MNSAQFFDSASLFLTSFFSTGCVVAAIVWLIYRAYQVVTKPLDELVNLLGFEIPLGPHLDLAGIRADEVTLHWKPADDRKSTHKYEVQVNGTIVGEVPQSDNFIIVHNLHPDHNYVFRVATVNTLDFRATSEPIRVRTKAASSGDLHQPSPSSPTTETPDDPATKAGPPLLRTFRTLPETLSTSVLAPPMTREVSNGPIPVKRIPMGRRVSPAIFNTPESQQSMAEDFAGSEETQQQLTQKLDDINRETAEAERQIEEEEQEAAATKADLLQERDELRASLKERDNASRELKKQVNILERENTAAQNKRTQQDRALQQRRGDMQKVKDDTARWAKEAEEIRQSMGQIQIDKQQYLDTIEKEKQALQEKHDQEIEKLKSIDQDIKDRSSQIKKLEREKSDSPVNAESSEQHNHLAAQDAEEERMWDEHMARLDDQYKLAYSEMESARRLCNDAYAQLQSSQRQLAYMAPPPVPTMNQPISRSSSLRQRRTPSGTNTTNASTVSGFPATSGPSFGNGMSTLPEGFTTSASPFFNINNGMTLDRPGGMTSFSSADVEKLTGGAPMSPGVGAALLPADLLSTADEEMPIRRNPSSSEHGTDHRQGSSTGGVLSGLGVFPGSSGVLPGLGAMQIPGLSDFSGFGPAPVPGPASPASNGSGTPSVFASPGASASNLAFQSPDQVDPDRRSIRSTRSFRAASSGAAQQSGSRFAQILGLDKFNRQRGKVAEDEGPALGSLSKTQSQSVPRDGLSDEDELSSGRRRNSSHSGNFFGSVLGRSATTSKATGVDASGNQKAAAARSRRPFQVFGGRDGWPNLLGGENRPASPRPVSTHSTELPRPSQDSSGWGIFLSNETFPARSSPLSSDWGQPQPAPISSSRIWGGSRHPSRRPSIQIGESTGLPYDIMEAETDGDSPPLRPIQAPIGTRPSQPIHRPSTPLQLNPAAADFQSLFSFNEKRERGERSAKSKKDKDKSKNDTEESPVLPHVEDASPPQSRMSRDTHSIMTAESGATDNMSYNSLEHTPSYNTELTPHGSIGKESFMSKLSRKSSSGKFGLPSFQRSDKKARNADKAKETVGEDLREDEDGLMSQSIDSISKLSEADRDEPRPGKAVRSWSAMFKVGKGKEKEKSGGDKTPSIDEASLTSASGAGYDDDDVETTA